MGVVVTYGGIAVGSDTGSIIETSEKESFVKEQTILNRSLSYRNIGNPCELYSVVLDGSVSAFPQNTQDENLGYWSKQVSKQDFSFESPIEITVNFDGNIYSSAGITITFDLEKNIYPTEVSTEWFLGGYSIAEENFIVNSAKFFFAKKVENYDTVKFTFYKMNLPENRLKVQRIEIGLVADSKTTFSLKNTTISRSISPISLDLPISTFNFSFIDRDNIEYFFQERQSVNVMFNDEEMGTFFVKNAKRTSQKGYTVSCEDYVGILNSVDFAGGIYVSKNADELLREIFSVAKIPVEIENVIKQDVVSGYIPYTTCRNAIKQILFAIQAVIDTSNSNFVKIYKQSDEVSQTITSERIMQGLNIKQNAIITGVSLTAHVFSPNTERQVLYDAKESGIGNNIFLKFSEPFHSLLIDKGTIVRSGYNFAEINAEENCLLIGQQFNHQKIVKTLKNPNLLSTESENLKKITNATLVSPYNVDKVLNSCYNYLIKTRTISAKIIEGKHESNDELVNDIPVKVGDVISVDASYEGFVTGRIETEKFNLNGGILVKDTILR